jgi:hypothetical protein
LAYSRAPGLICDPKLMLFWLFLFASGCIFRVGFVYDWVTTHNIRQLVFPLGTKKTIKRWS